MPAPLDKLAEPLLKRHDNIDAEIATMTGKHLAACKEKREDQREICAEAKNAGISVKAFRAVIAHRRLARKQARLGNNLNEDDGAQFDLLIDQLGPLGMAAARRAGHPVADDDDRDLRGTAQKQAEQEREAETDRLNEEERLARLGRGPVLVHS